jgi:hypothetical protein
MLAMALFFEKYVKVSMTSTTCNRIEAAGLQWWRETLGNPLCLPSKVLNWTENDAVKNYGQECGNEVFDDL